MIQTKSYFAGTVEEAMAAARVEFGDEALLIEARHSRPGEEHLGAYEVIIGAPEPPAAAVPATPAKSAPADGSLPAQLAGLHRELERMSRLLVHLAGNTTSLRRAELEPLLAELCASDIAPELIQEIVRRLPETPPASAVCPLAALRVRVHDLLTGWLRCETSLGRTESGPETVALIGPPGSGKTTTLAKLAVRCGIEKQRAVAFITTDTYRIAAADQIQTLARILGVPCTVVEHGGALTHALDEFRHKDLVLIDTPGMSAGEWDLARDWSRFLLAHPQICSHLVLNSVNRSESLERLIENWRIFNPRSLIYTRLDEISSPGGAASAAIRTGLPVSYLARGQSIPEDIEPASVEAMLAFLTPAIQARGAAA